MSPAISGELTGDLLSYTKWIAKHRGDWKEPGISRAEKRERYYCSREWGLLKREVRKRCGGICERCGLHPMYAVHHLSYARLFCEELFDLLGICNGCHEFIHGYSDYDPLEEPDKAWPCTTFQEVETPPPDVQVVGLVVVRGNRAWCLECRDELPPLWVGSLCPFHSEENGFCVNCGSENMHRYVCQDCYWGEEE
jgi:hypothetical protein